MNRPRDTDVLARRFCARQRVAGGDIEAVGMIGGEITKKTTALRGRERVPKPRSGVRVRMALRRSRKY